MQLVGAAISVAADEPSGRIINEGLLGTNQSVQGAGSLVRSFGPDWARTDASLQGSYRGRPVYDCATGAWNPVLLAKGISADRAEGGTPEVIVDYSPACLTTSVPPGTNPSVSGEPGSPAPHGARSSSCTVLVSNFMPYDPTYGNGSKDPNPYEEDVVLTTVSGLAPGAYRVSRLAVDADDSGGPAAAPEKVRVGRDGRFETSFVSYGDSVSLVEVTKLGHRSPPAKGSLHG